MLCVLKALIAWVVLIFIGVNLAGFVTRGLLWALPPFEASTDQVRRIIEDETRRMRFANSVLNVLTWAGAAGYLYALYRYWGIGLAVAGAVLILTRVPDLLWELQTGKTTSQKRPTGPVHIIATVLLLTMLPLIWYSLCR